MLFLFARCPRCSLYRKPYYRTHILSSSADSPLGHRIKGVDDMARCFTVEKIQEYVDAHEPVTHRRCRGGLQSLLRFVAAMGDVLVKVKRARTDATCGLCGELVLSRAGTACMVCGVWCVVCGVWCVPCCMRCSARNVHCVACVCACAPACLCSRGCSPQPSVPMAGIVHPKCITNLSIV